MQEINIEKLNELELEQIDYNVLNLDELEIYLSKINGVSNNPKKELLFSKAYELGHSFGNCDIKSYYEELVDLIK